jgi:asparagine synthase (glutamine-hydrolysing)
MCGIVGLFANQSHCFERHELVDMQHSLLHRGPDESGISTWSGESHETSGCLEDRGRIRYGLAHTRLAILDLTKAAHQPMQDKSKQVTLVLNGEIYNYVELRSELMGLGYKFTSTGDTEVLLMAYLEWGSECVNRLIGMYAFLILDLNRRILFAARDPFGIKPLYYSRTTRGLALASEIKALRRLANVGKESNSTSLLRYLRFGMTELGAETMFSDVEQLEPGHALILNLDSLKLNVYPHYTLRVSALSVNDISFAKAADQLRQLFLESLELHYRSDVPVGAALSGGIDSSSIVCGLREIAGPSVEIACFTYAASNSPLNEESWARIVAATADATLRTTSPGSTDLLRELPELMRSLDEPLAGLSLYAQYNVFKLARSAGVKVLVDGQGADEILGGYDNYLSARVATLLRRGDIRRACALVNGARRRGKPIRNLALQSLDYLAPPTLHTPLRKFAGRELTPPWVQSKWFESRQAKLIPFHSTRAREVLRDQLINDLTVISVPSLLRCEDRNSMAWSVESRVPFLVPSIVEYCLSMPEEYLVDDTGQSKAVFRKAMRGLVPDVILDRQDKIGFEPPSNDWLRESSEYVQEELRTTVIDCLPFIDADRVRKLGMKALSVNGSNEEVWRLIFVSRWALEHHITFV